MFTNRDGLSCFIPEETKDTSFSYQTPELSLVNRVNMQHVSGDEMFFSVAVVTQADTSGVCLH